MKLIWTELALSDLESIRDYIARDSAAYAARFFGRLVEARRHDVDRSRRPESPQRVAKHKKHSQA